MLYEVITGKLLSPRKIVMNVRERMKEKGPEMVKNGKDWTDNKALLGDYITAEELWACASVVSRTSWALMIAAPCITANTAAATLPTIRRSTPTPPSIDPIIDFLETPTRTGAPKAVNCSRFSYNFV